MGRDAPKMSVSLRLTSGFSMAPVGHSILFQLARSSEAQMICSASQFMTRFGLCVTVMICRRFLTFGMQGTSIVHMVWLSRFPSAD